MKEAAATLRVAPSTLDREIAAGRLAFVRIRRRMLFTPEQLAEYVDQQREGEA